MVETPRNLVASRRVVYCWTSNFGFTMCWGFWFAGVAWHVWKCQNFKNPRGHIFVTSLLFTQKSEEFLMRIDELDDCFLWWRKKVPSHESCFLIWEPKKWTFLAAHPMNFGELHHYALAPSFSIATAFHFFPPKRLNLPPTWPVEDMNMSCRCGPFCRLKSWNGFSWNNIRVIPTEIIFC